MAHQPDGERVPPPQWAPCPAGEFQRLSARLGKRRQRRAFLKGMAVVTTAALTGGGLWLWLRSGTSDEPAKLDEPAEFLYAGISCTEVRGLAHAYAMGKLDERRREQVRRHVAQCPRCGPIFKSMGIGI